jgi:hypothetical protein
MAGPEQRFLRLIAHRRSDRRCCSALSSWSATYYYRPAGAGSGLLTVFFALQKSIGRQSLISHQGPQRD